MPKDKIKGEKEEGFLNILFFLSTIYISLIAGSYSVLRSLNSKVVLDWQINLPIYLVSMILVGIILLVGFYLLLIFFIGSLELKSYYLELDEKQINVRRKLRELVLSGPSELISTILPIFLFLTLLLFVYFNEFFAKIAFSVYLVFFCFIAFAQNKTKTFISSMTIFDPKPTWKSYALLGTFILIVFSMLYIIFGVLIFSFANFEINLDKEFYTSNEGVYITIYSKGMVKPVPKNITYGDSQVNLDYIKDVGFPEAPVYIYLNSSILKEQPYNSFIQINYDIPRAKYFLLRNELTQSKFIPVINVKNN